VQEDGIDHRNHCSYIADEKDCPLHSCAGLSRRFNDIQPNQRQSPTFARLRRLTGGSCGFQVSFTHSNQSTRHPPPLGTRMSMLEIFAEAVLSESGVLYDK
jgi:hypothetical protein